MAGDAETGVTIHRTTAELDAGPIAAQRAFPIGPDDDAGVVYERAAALAVELLDEVLPEPAFEPQPEEGATYAEKIGPADRELDWSRPAEELVQPGPRAVAAHRRARRGRRPAGDRLALAVVDGGWSPRGAAGGRRRMTLESSAAAALKLLERDSPARPRNARDPR